MRNSLKSSVVGLGILVLAGCAGTELDRARQVTPEGSAFQNELYGGYLALASSEFAEADFSDSDFFARRAITSAGAAAPQPQELAERVLPEDVAPDLSHARNLLVDALARGGAEKFPALAADAQVSFDCWMQEQEENFQPDDIAACRGQFISAYSSLNVGLTPLAAMADPAPEPKPMAQPVTFVVYFNFDSTDLDQAARRKLGEVVAEARERDSAQILVTGHADRAGANNYNNKLSELRAMAIADALANEGIPKVLTDVEAFGEFQPAVATEDDVQERMNRRVEIVVK
jgi:outer membrane protein OmpA-like peptidoglycan-associated protein